MSTSVGLNLIISHNEAEISVVTYRYFSLQLWQPNKHSCNTYICSSGNGDEILLLSQKVEEVIRPSVESDACRRGLGVMLEKVGE